LASAERAFWPPARERRGELRPQMTRLLSVVGTPSPLLYATLNVVQAMTKVSGGEPLVITAHSVDGLRSAFPSTSDRKGKSVILFSDYPEQDFLSLLVDTNTPMLICADHFTTVAHFAVVTRELGGVYAARHASMGIVKIEPLMARLPRSSLIVNDPAKALPIAIADFAKFFRLPLGGEALAEISSLLGCGGARAISLGEYAAKTIPQSNDAREMLERRSPLENELIDFLAAQYDGIVRGHRLEKLEWPVYALLRPEFPDRLTIGPIDLTGPARFIYYGPYFALPAGAWSAEVSIEVSGCYSNDPIAIDVVARKILAIVRMKLPRNGVYGCQIRFQIEDPSQPVEIRLQLLTGAIEGVIRMHSITLHRVSTLDEAESQDEARREPA
jgi:hypothetical protein